MFELNGEPADVVTTTTPGQAIGVLRSLGLTDRQVADALLDLLRSGHLRLSTADGDRLYRELGVRRRLH